MKIRRALISLSDKRNLEKIISCLIQENIEIISTGGTYKEIKKITEKVINIEEWTNFSEIMNGRVKTLHPAIHGALLADRENEAHLTDMKANNILPIDLVIVNLYPFQETVSSGADDNKIVENIDIGGPTMIRSGAKNFKNILTITDINDYDELIKNLAENNLEFRRKMAKKAFSYIAEYDNNIANWFNKEEAEGLKLEVKLKSSLRYGENPHQKAELYQDNSNCGIVSAKQIQGKELSYNNIVDSDSSYNLIKEFEEPSVAIIKHCNPCGVASSKTIENAFKKALSCDPVSSFGGIVAVNREINKDLAEEIAKIFFEVIVAPKIVDDAKEILAKKKNLRVLLLKDKNIGVSSEIKTVSGGLLWQEQDTQQISQEDLQYVTERKPNEEELKNLLFAFKAIKHIKSNAILFAKDNMSIAVGAGQMSRVDSVRMASLKLADFCQNNKNFNKNNLVLASDAFFPFADGVELAAKEGVTAIIQPGGSIRDKEVIDAANKYNITMVFTGIRHFKH